MQAHNVIIICSGLARTTTDRDLNEILKTLQELKKNPVLVLGPDGDELLRRCDAIENCEIVFDPNFEGGFFSSLKAGLFATQRAAFTLSLQTPVPPKQVWHALDEALFKTQHNGPHILRPVIRNSPVSLEFPLLVTTQGIAKLKSLPAQSPWPLSEHEVIFHDILVSELIGDQSPLASTYP